MNKSKGTKKMKTKLDMKLWMVCSFIIPALVRNEFLKKEESIRALASAMEEQFRNTIR